MKYAGRFSLLSIVLFSVTIWSIIHYITGYKLILLDVLGAAVYIPLCLWLGLQYDKTRYYAETDSLTGIHNRRYLHNIFPKLQALTDKNKNSMAFLLMDINNFKMINDQYGHKRGDLVLQHISDLLLRSTRKSDVFARWGGDEFLIVVPLISEPDINPLIKRLHDGLNEISEKIQTQTTVSIGLSMYPRDAANLDDLLAIADDNMYQIKLEERGSI